MKSSAFKRESAARNLFCLSMLHNCPVSQGRTPPRLMQAIASAVSDALNISQCGTSASGYQSRAISPHLQGGGRMLALLLALLCPYAEHIHHLAPHLSSLAPMSPSSVISNTMTARSPMMCSISPPSLLTPVLRNSEIPLKQIVFH